MNHILYNIYDEVLHDFKRAKELQREGSDYQRGYIDALSEMIKIIIKEQNNINYEKENSTVVSSEEQKQ